MWWFCRMAIGMNDKYEPAPAAQLLEDWNRVAAELDALPSGRPLFRELDRILPKSQVLIARKPDVAGPHRLLRRPLVALEALAPRRPGQDWRARLAMERPAGVVDAHQSIPLRRLRTARPRRIQQ